MSYLPFSEGPIELRAKKKMKGRITATSYLEDSDVVIEANGNLLKYRHFHGIFVYLADKVRYQFCKLLSPKRDDNSRVVFP